MYAYIYIFVVSYGPIEWFFNRYIEPIYEILTGTITPGQSGPGSNDHDSVLHTPQIFTERYSLVSYLGPHFFRGGLTYLSK